MSYRVCTIFPKPFKHYCHRSVTDACGPTFSATVSRQNHVEVIHLYQDLERGFHQKSSHVSGCPPPPL